jgi:peptide/nickel transport system ATP-binding protein
MSAWAWRLTDLSVDYRSGPPWRQREFRAVDHASLAVAVGERVAIVGRSGSGKTSLAQAGLGLIPRSEGRVEVVGNDMTHATASDWRRVRPRAQFLVQNSAAMLSPSMTLHQLLVESARLHRPNEDAASVADAMLEAVDLKRRADAKRHELSGGERRRAGIARVLVAQPGLVVCDEPTSGLDASLKADLIDLMFERLGKDCAIVILSHDLPLMFWACQRILVVDSGRCVDEIDPRNIGSPTHPITDALLRAAGII